MRTKWMQFSLCRQISRICFFSGYIVAKRSNIAIDGNSCAKPFGVFPKMNSKKSGFISFAKIALVLVIFGPRCFSKVVELIVRSIAVFMVYIEPRKASIVVKENKSMRPVGFAIYSDGNVSTTMKMPCDSTNFGPEGRYLNPSEQTCLWTIVKQLTQSFSGNICRIFGSHDVTLSQIGKRRGRVSSACLALPC